MRRPGLTAPKTHIVGRLLVPLLLIQPFPAQQPAPTTGRALNLIIIEGEGAINNIRQRTAREAIVEVEDENHKPIGGAVVTFTLPSSGPTGTFANGSRVLSLITDSKGQAVMRGLQPARTSGSMPIKISASFQGQSATATIVQTNAIVAGAAGSGAGIGGVIAAHSVVAAVIVGAAVAVGVTVAKVATGGNAATPTRVPGTLTPGAPTIGPPR